MGYFLFMFKYTLNSPMQATTSPTITHAVRVDTNCGLLRMCILLTNYKMENSLEFRCGNFGEKYAWMLYTCQKQNSRMMQGNIYVTLVH